MHIVTRISAAAAVALTGSLSIGLMSPTTAHAATHPDIATAASAHPAHATHDARVSLPAPNRLTGPSDGTAPLTVHVTHRSVCAGTTKCVAFSGTGVPDQTVVITYQVTEDPLFGSRGAAGITTVSERANVDGTGNWSLLTEFPNAVIATDTAGKRSVLYHVVESDDVLTLEATARFEGAIPIR